MDWTSLIIGLVVIIIVGFLILVYYGPSNNVPIDVIVGFGILNIMVILVAILMLHFNVNEWAYFSIIIAITFYGLAAYSSGWFPFKESH